MGRVDSEQLIRVGVEGSTARIEVNRPDKRNAMTVAMWNDLSAACDRLAADPAVRAVLVRGVGRSFCTGADISALREGDATVKEVVGRAEASLRALPVPTVAVIHGHCWGAGLQIATACDLRIAADDATFAVPPAKLGIVYPATSLAAMVALIGPAATKQLVFTAAPIDAPAAEHLGLIDQVVAVDDLDSAATDLVASFSGSLLSHCAAKAIVNAIVDGADGRASYQHWMSVWADSADGAEGPNAFLERRPAEFSWHPSELGGR
jgi:enoyl-CoA hydratase/carnithine racemase